MEDDMGEDIGQRNEGKARKVDGSSRILPPPALPGVAYGPADSMEGIDTLMHNLSEVVRRIMSLVIMGVDVTEVYSPERVAAVASKFGLTQGSSF